MSEYQILTVFAAFAFTYSLNVESGLNDGICVPVILFLLALAAGSVEGAESAGLMMELALEVIGIGIVVGLGLAVVCGFALRHWVEPGWTSDTWLQMPIIALSIVLHGLSANPLAAKYGARVVARGNSI